ncbi:MAG: HAMP domain-containing histidine kinase [Planctomycetes bacterium]|nr:HAMP domain-containing histidine kinase [Planctomycetota bacterium]
MIVSQKYGIPILATVFLCTLMSLWLNYESQRQEKIAYHYLKKSAFAVITAMEGAIQVDARGGIMRKGRIRMIMDEVLSKTTVQYIALIQGSRTLISTGIIEGIPTRTKEEGEKLIPGSLFCWRKISITNCSQGNRGPFWASQFSENEQEETLRFSTDQKFLVAFSDSDYKAQLAESQRSIYITAGIASLAILAGISLWIFSIRGESLKHQLRITQERVQHYREFEFAAFGLAHETRHPLGLIRARAQQIASDDTAQNSHVKSAIDIIEETDVATSRLSEFMHYAKLKKPKLQQVKAAEICDNIGVLLSDDARAQSIDMRIEVNPNLMLMVDRDMLQRVIVNLLLNSLQACHENDSILLSLQQGKVASTAVLLVEDTGQGVPENLRKTVFQPYVTGHEDGHGIGLAIVKKIADEHGWKIFLKSTPEEGTSFTITGIRCAENGVIHA